MRKIFYAIAAVLLLQSCDEIEPPKPDIGTEQQGLLNIITQYRSDRSSAPNSAKKSEIHDEYEKRIQSYVKDTLNGVLYRFVVKIDDVYNREWRGVEVFVFNCSDDKVKYWSELHFKNADSMRENEMYKMLSVKKTGSIDTISFAALPDIELEKDDYVAGVNLEMWAIQDSTALKLREKNKKEGHNK